MRKSEFALIEGNDHKLIGIKLKILKINADRYNLINKKYVTFSSDMADCAVRDSTYPGGESWLIRGGELCDQN